MVALDVCAGLMSVTDDLLVPGEAFMSFEVEADRCRCARVFDMRAARYDGRQIGIGHTSCHLAHQGVGVLLQSVESFFDKVLHGLVL